MTGVPQVPEGTELAPVFRALGDPVRLAMVQRLSDGGGPRTIAAVCLGFGISRQGARKHLHVLAEAELISLRPAGRDVIVALDPQTLDRARKLIAELEMRWESRLQALKQFVEET